MAAPPVRGPRLQLPAQPSPPHSRRRPGKSNWPPLRSAPSSRAGNGKVQTAAGRGFTVCIDECVACGHSGAASSIPAAVAACDPRAPLPEVPPPVPPSRARLPGAPTRRDPDSAPTSVLHVQGPLGRTPRPSGSVPLSLLPRGRGKEPLWPHSRPEFPRPSGGAALGELLSTSAASPPRLGPRFSLERRTFSRPGSRPPPPRSLPDIPVCASLLVPSAVLTPPRAPASPPHSPRAAGSGTFPGPGPARLRRSRRGLTGAQSQEQPQGPARAPHGAVGAGWGRAGAGSRSEGVSSRRASSPLPPHAGPSSLSAAGSCRAESPPWGAGRPPPGPDRTPGLPRRAPCWSAA